MLHNLVVALRTRLGQRSQMMRNEVKNRLLTHAQNVDLALGNPVRGACPRKVNWQFLTSVDIMLSVAWLHLNDDRGRLALKDFLDWVHDANTPFSRANITALLSDTLYWERESPWSMMSAKQQYIDIDHPSVMERQLVAVPIIRTEQRDRARRTSARWLEVRGYVGRGPAYEHKVPPQYLRTDGLLPASMGLTGSAGCPTPVKVAQVLCRYIAMQMVLQPNSSVVVGVPVWDEPAMNRRHFVLAPFNVNVMSMSVRHTPYSNVSEYARIMYDSAHAMIGDKASCILGNNSTTLECCICDGDNTP